MKNKDTNLSATLVNAIVEAYITETVYAKQDEAIKRCHLLKMNVHGNQIELKNKREELYLLEKELNGQQSADVEARRAELKLLVESADDLASEIEPFETIYSGPHHISVIQEATIDQ